MKSRHSASDWRNPAPTIRPENVRAFSCAESSKNIGDNKLIGIPIKLGRDIWTNDIAYPILLLLGVRRETNKREIDIMGLSVQASLMLRQQRRARQELKHETAAEVVTRQHLNIAHAVQILTDQLHNMTEPESATWMDVGKFAMASDVARMVIAAFEEQ